MNPRRHNPASGRAFTLLEMLLAVAVLAMVSLLAATMLAQAGELTGDNERRDATLDLTRVVRLMTEQWDDRRSATTLGAGGATYSATPGEIAFVTARPILDPTKPLAIVRYRVELIGASVVEDERRYNLVYEERPISEWSEGEAASDADEEERWKRARRLVLLERCTGLRLERFRPAEEAVMEAMGAEFGGGGRDDESDALAEEEALDRQAELMRLARSEWVEFADDARRLPPALRLCGKYEGEAFACVFIGAVSR